MTSRVIIRAATESDFPDILAIYNDAVLNTTAIWNESSASLDDRIEWWQARLAQGYPVLVAEASNPSGPSVMGYGTFGPFRPHEGYRHTVEQSVYVAREARRRGIASALLNELESIARDQGRHAMIGGLDAENTPSYSLHEKHEFVEVARMPEVGRKFDRWLTLVLMQKILD